MNFTIRPLLTLLFLIPFCASAQIEEIYIDDNMNRMNKEQFLNNCSKFIYRCYSSVSDSIKVNIVHSRFKFGKISPEVHEKLLSKLYGDNKHKTDQTIVLRYVNGYLHSGINLEKYLYREKKCLKKINKKTSSKVFQLVKYSFDSIQKKHKELTFIKINNYLDDIRASFPDSTRYVVIQPKGDYFSSESIVHPKKIIPFINKSDWSEYKKDLKYSNSLKYKKGYGFFKSLTYRYRARYFDYDLTCF